MLRPQAPPGREGGHRASSRPTAASFPEEEGAEKLPAGQAGGFPAAPALQPSASCRRLVRVPVPPRPWSTHDSRSLPGRKPPASAESPPCKGLRGRERPLSPSPGRARFKGLNEWAGRRGSPSPTPRGSVPSKVKHARQSTPFPRSPAGTEPRPPSGSKFISGLPAPQ